MGEKWCRVCNCENCRFFFISKSEIKIIEELYCGKEKAGPIMDTKSPLFKIGICRRNPPQIINATFSRNLFQDVAWPTVNCEDWCGEWKSNDEETSYL